MNKILGNYNAMHLATQRYLDEQSSVWSTISKIVEYKNQFDELITRTADLDTNVKSTQGVSQRKEELKNAMAIKVAVLSGGIQAYAHEIGDLDLAKSVAVTQTYVNQLKDTEVDGFVRAFVAKIQSHIAALADYGINEPRLTELQTTLSEWNDLQGKPRTLLNNKYVNLNSLEELIAEANTLLSTKIDKIMMMFVTTNSTFYEGYKRSRVIVDR